MSNSPEVPATWASARLDEICAINERPFSPLKPAYSLPAHFVPMAAVKEEYGGIDVSATRPLGEVIKGYTAFVPGDVLFAKITPCMENGKVALVPLLGRHVGFGSTEFHVLRAGDAVLPEWVARYLSQLSFRKLARQDMSGSAGQLRVQTAWLSSASIPVAPLPEQRRIVQHIDELLSDIDAAVVELVAAKRKLALYRQSLLKSAVEGTLTAEWRRAKPPQEAGTELLARALRTRRSNWEERQLARYRLSEKEPPTGWAAQYPEPVLPDLSNLHELPGQWAWASLDMLGEIASGVAKGSKTKPDEVLREVPYLRVANVQRGRLDLGDIKTIFASERHIEELTLQAGDVLFNEGGDRDKLGRGWVWRNRVPDCIHQNHVFRMRPLLAELNSEFISHHGNTFGQRWFESAGKQTTNLASINLSILRAFPVPVPPPDEQSQIIAIVREQLESMLQQEIAVERGLKLATAQRQNILRAAFSGQLVPQDPNDEPASVLLERIRAEGLARAATPSARRPRAAQAGRRSQHD